MYYKKQHESFLVLFRFCLSQDIYVQLSIFWEIIFLIITCIPQPLGFGGEMLKCWEDKMEPL